MCTLKTGTNEPIYKIGIVEIESQMKTTNLWLPRAKGMGRDKLGDWD